MSEGPQATLWSVWHPAWHDVYKSSAAGVLGQEECRAHLVATYRQRLGEGAVIVPSDTLHPCPYKLRLRGWVRAGSGLSEGQAREMAAEHEAEPVPEGSAREQELVLAARQALEKLD